MKSAKIICSIILLLLTATGSEAQRSERLLTEWEFHRGVLNSKSGWQQVRVPHDWAITGPFSEENDLQVVAVKQNGETQPLRHQGRTGALPYSGEGHYRTTFSATKGKEVTLIFDGAMSEARVSVNGQELIFWPYGYNSFSCNATPALREGDNLLEVSLRNSERSSRWYPGAGLYRNVHLIEHERVHVPVWGTQVLTELSPTAAGEPTASVTLRTELEGVTPGQRVSIHTELLDEQGRVVGSRQTRVEPHYLKHGEAVSQTFRVEHPLLWSPETPHLYSAVSRIYVDDVQTDCYSTRFGIRSIDYLAEDGFYLNGQKRKMQGVCLHHDLGPLGAAIDRSALRHQLTMLKDMGCDAIRTSHNMPAPELVQLCEEMGLMMMLEPFDEWDIAKCDSGYHRWFGDWATADMTNMLRQYRNSPAVVMWSIGNEVPSQGSEQGYRTASMLRDICRRLDPTRPVTAGMDQVDNAMNNGFGATLDVPGFNYRAHRYTEAHERFPQGLLLGSETASTVSSRGVYKFPVVPRYGACYPDHQSSSYDTEACSWSNVPDIDFANMDDLPWTIGQFVWTGFDYLGEPSPYDTNAWPSHSSLFGIIDLASLPKDRYYLYRSQWNRREHTLHLLPHWTWPGREGEVTPVMAYTDAEEAELYLNGQSLGVARKQPKALSHDGRKITLESLMRYRLVWPDVKYEPGTLVVRARYADGQVLCDTVRTAGEPHHLQLEWANEGEGDGLRYVTVSICDKDGNLCPTANNEVSFSVKGGAFRACANGDPTCLELFHEPHMHAFSGQLTAIVDKASSNLPLKRGGSSPETTLTVKAKGLKSATIKL